MKYLLLILFLFQSSLWALSPVKPELVHPPDGSYLLIIQPMERTGHTAPARVYRARIETKEEKKSIIITSEGFETPLDLEFFDDSFFFTIRKKVKFEHVDGIGYFLIVENYSASIAAYDFEGKKQYHGLQATLYSAQRSFYSSNGKDRDIHDPEVTEARFTLLEWPESKAQPANIVNDEATPLRD